MSSCKKLKDANFRRGGRKFIKRAYGMLAVALAFAMAITSVLPAYASELGETAPLAAPEVAATPVVYYKEDFGSGYTNVGYEGPKGIYATTDATIAEKTEGTDKALGVTAEYQKIQVNARWSKQSKWADASCHTDLSSKKVVYEFKVKLLGTSYLNVSLRSQNGGTKLSNLCRINNNELSFPGSTITAKQTLSENTWYQISAVYDYATKERTVYVDGTEVGKGTIQNIDSLDLTQMTDMIRFHADSATNANLLLDDIAVYENDGLVTDMFPTKENTTEPAPDEPTEPTIFYKENFQSARGSYITNKAYGVAIPGAAYGTAAAYKDSDDNYAMRLIYDGTGSELQANVRWSDAAAWGDNAADCNTDMTGKKVVYEYSIKLISDIKNTFYAVLRSNNNGTKTSSMFSVKENILTFSGIEADAISMTKGTWYRLSMIYDYQAGTRAVYVNGTKIGEGAIPGFTNLNAASMTDMVRFTTQGMDKTVTADFLVDNMAVYESNKLQDISFDSEGDEENIPQVDTKEGYEIYTTNFEISNPFTTSGAYENTISWERENDSNKVLKFERQVQHHFHADLQGVAKEAGSIVYEFKMKLLNAASTAMTMQLKDKNGAYTPLCAIKAGTLTTGNSNASIGTLTENEWATISVIQNYNTRTKEIYLNGLKVSEGQPIAAEFGNGADASILRVWVGDITATVEEHKDSFMIDDIRIYQGTQLHEEVIEDTVTITIDESTSIFTKTDMLTKPSVLVEMMNGYISLHTRNGMVYNNGAKTLLGSGTIEINGKYYVVAREICEVLGTSYAENGDTVTINGQQATVTKQDEKLWVEAEYFFTTLLGKKVVTDTKAKSSGMTVAGDTEFSFPSENPTSDSVFFARSVLQDLNDFLFFERPSAAEIQAAYEVSESYRQHPRIQITAEDVENIKSEVQYNGYKQGWYSQIMAVADYLVEENTAALKYELRDGVRLLAVARDMLEHMYVLGMAYQLTGEQKYADRAWTDLEAVSNFPDWHPTHDLDPAEMSAAVAIGYDWMYDAFTETQRKVIEKGIYKLCFQDAVSAYNLGSAPIGSAVLSGINHNIVLNGGFAMGAMAFADVYPEVCNYIISGAITASDIMLTEWGPDGAWKEGPTYWEYAMDYSVKMFSSLETMYGTCFSLDACEGLSTAANYMLNLQSDVGSFNYGDGSVGSYYVPEMFYLSNKYGDGAVTSTVLGIKHGEMADVEDMVHSLMWYDTSISESGTQMPLDSAFYGEGIATFRDEWTDGATAFAAIHGGITRLCHAQVDAGTFIYDYAGIRWASELGSTPYDTAVTAEYGVNGRRWLLYRSLAEAHNTLVINPTNGNPGQKLEASAKLTKVASKDKGAIAVMDLTESYSDNATSAIRGMFFTDDRTSLVVRDEITLKNNDSTVYWFMQTGTNVEISSDGTYAILSQAGKQVRLDFTTTGNATATLGVGPSTRAMLGTTSPIISTSTSSGKYDQEDADKNRIYIKLENASGDVSITVKLTPTGVAATDVADYNKAISEWTIPDGTVAEKPTLEATKLKVTIDGREVKFDDNNEATFLCIDGKIGMNPETIVTVDEKYTYTISKVSRSRGTILITVKDKNQETVYTTFTIYMEEIPQTKIPEGAPEGFADQNALQVIAVEASAEPEKSAGNVAWKVLDQDRNTRWTSQGLGNWILLELEKLSSVDDMLILFKNGHIRSTFFNISVSEDGVNYTQIFYGKSGGSSIGAQEAYEQFSLGGVNAKFIKIGCNGNTAQGVTGWNNIGEVVFTGNVVIVDDDTNGGNSGNTDNDGKDDADNTTDNDDKDDMDDVFDNDGKNDGDNENVGNGDKDPINNGSAANVNKNDPQSGKTDKDSKSDAAQKDHDSNTGLTGNGNVIGTGDAGVGMWPVVLVVTAVALLVFYQFKRKAKHDHS